MSIDADFHKGHECPYKHCISTNTDRNCGSIQVPQIVFSCRRVMNSHSSCFNGCIVCVCVWGGGGGGENTEYSE